MERVVLSSEHQQKHLQGRSGKISENPHHSPSRIPQLTIMHVARIPAHGPPTEEEEAISIFK